MKNTKINFKPKNILVAGGAGFIGLNFIELLLKKNIYNIIVVDSLTYASSKNELNKINIKKNINFYKCNINNKIKLKSIFKKHKIDTVVNFAAESHVDRSIDNAEKFIQTNVLGTYNIIEVAKKYWKQKFNLDKEKCRFHQISTDEVFGSLKKNEKKFDEKSNYKPNSPYAASKASADMVVRSYISTYKMPITMSYCTNNYGKYQHKEKFIPTVINACINKKIIPLYGNGQNIRDWIHVDDHCAAILDILKKGKVGETFCIGANNELSNKMIIDEIIFSFKNIAESYNYNYFKLIKFVKDRPGHDWRYALNNKKIKKNINWSPKVSFRKGLIETINWYLKKNKC